MPTTMLRRRWLQAQKSSTMQNHFALSMIRLHRTFLTKHAWTNDVHASGKTAVRIGKHAGMCSGYRCSAAPGQISALSAGVSRNFLNYVHRIKLVRSPLPATDIAIRQFGYRRSMEQRNENEMKSASTTSEDQHAVPTGKSYSENLFTIPNLLSVLRIAVTPYIGYLVIHHQWHLATGLSMAAAVTDVVDGWIARRYPSQRSMAGSFLDPLADKLLVATLFLSLTYVGAIPLPLAILVIGRDILLIAAAFVVRYQSIPKPVTLNKYFDLSYATARLQPTTISKYNTAVQLLLVTATVAAPIFDLADSAGLHALWYITAISTIASGWSYVGNRKTFTFLLKQRKPPGPSNLP